MFPPCFGWAFTELPHTHTHFSLWPWHMTHVIYSLPEQTIWYSSLYLRRSGLRCIFDVLSWSQYALMSLRCVNEYCPLSFSLRVLKNCCQQHSRAQRQMAWVSVIGDIPHIQMPWSANAELCHAEQWKPWVSKRGRSALVQCGSHFSHQIPHKRHHEGDRPG